MSYVITKLAKALKRGDALYMDPHNSYKLQASRFKTLFEQDTLRIACSNDFAQFAHDIYPEDYATNPDIGRIVERVNQGRWWFETSGWMVDRQPHEVALYSPGVIDNQVNINLVVLTENRVIQSDPGFFFGSAEIADAQLKTGMAWLVQTLYAMDALSDRKDALYQRSERIGVPPDLRDDITENPIFNFVYIKGHTRTTAGEHSVLDSSGRRWHYVRAHKRELPSGKETWVRHHTRGDPALGVVRKVFVGKGS